MITIVRRCVTPATDAQRDLARRMVRQFGPNAAIIAEKWSRSNDDRRWLAVADAIDDLEGGS